MRESILNCLGDYVVQRHVDELDESRDKLKHHQSNTKLYRGWLSSATPKRSQNSKIQNILDKYGNWDRTIQKHKSIDRMRVHRDDLKYVWAPCYWMSMRRESTELDETTKKITLTSLHRWWKVATSYETSTRWWMDGWRTRDWMDQTMDGRDEDEEWQKHIEVVGDGSTEHVRPAWRAGEGGSRQFGWGRRVGMHEREMVRINRTCQASVTSKRGRIKTV